MKAKGIALRESKGDGIWRQTERAGSTAAVTAKGEQPDWGRFLYFDVDDGFAGKLDGATVRLTVEFLDTGCESISVFYDSTDISSSVRSGAFRSGGSRPVGQTGAWRTETFDLPECWFVNRNNDVDFRIGAEGGDQTLIIRAVEVQIIP